MRKIFSSIGLTSRPKLERFQSSSLEQISSPGSSSANGDSESFDGSVKSGKIKKSPSLQSLKLVSGADCWLGKHESAQLVLYTQQLMADKYLL